MRLESIQAHFVFNSTMGQINHVNIVTIPYCVSIYGELIHIKNRILSEFTFFYWPLIILLAKR